MDERMMQLRVGMMFLATLFVAAILLVLFGNLPRWVGTYPVKIRFEHAGGVMKSTPVRKSGILIGRVDDVQLIEGDSGVLVTVKIQRDKTIYDNEQCYISRDLLGDTAITFVPYKTKGPKPKPIIQGAEIEGFVSDDPTGLKRALQGPIDTVTETGRALKEASDQLKSAAAKVETILDAEDERISKVLDNAAVSLEGIRNVLGDKETQQRLSAAMKRLPDTLDNMSETFQSADESLKAFARRSEKDGKSAVERMVETIEMTERTLRRFSESSEPGKAPPAEQIAQAVENVGEITSVLRSVVERIDRGEGSLGALLNDRQLYDRLNRAARNIEQVSRELKPIVADARVFSDKVARHPGVIIRDAVQPGVGIK